MPLLCLDDGAAGFCVRCEVIGTLFNDGKGAGTKGSWIHMSPSVSRKNMLEQLFIV